MRNPFGRLRDPRIGAVGKDVAGLRKEVVALRKEVAGIRKTSADIHDELRTLRKMTDVARHVAAAPTMAEVEAFVAERQHSMRETLRLVSEERMSFARYGDGELKLMLRPTYNLKFQPWVEGLAADLRRILTQPQDGLLVGFPNLFHDAHWEGVWADIWRPVSATIPPGITFGNSHVSRPIFFSMLQQEGVALWREVWDSRDVVVITGTGSRFEPIPQLFDNVRSWERVDSTPVDAYRDLPRVYDELEKVDPDKLHILALGPAGTVAAADLARRGRWSVDIGHISSSYVSVFLGGAWPERLDVTVPVEPGAPIEPPPAV